MTLIDRIKKHEHLSLTVYPDLDKFAIGYGHQCKSNHPPITQAQADAYLKQDIEKARFCVDQIEHCKSLDICRYEACVELSFWLGCQGFKNFVKMQKALADKDYHLAALELYNSDIGSKYSKRARVLSEIIWTGGNS